MTGAEELGLADESQAVLGRPVEHPRGVISHTRHVLA